VGTRRDEGGPAGLLLDGEWHVLHFIGRGDFDPGRDEGVLGLVGTRQVHTAGRRRHRNKAGEQGGRQILWAGLRGVFG
jgi:hypothetical protein